MSNKQEEKLKIPKGQILWETIHDGKGKIIQIITSDATKSKWHLFNVSGEKLTKIETAIIPIFEKRIQFDAEED